MSTLRMGPTSWHERHGIARPFVGRVLVAFGARLGRKGSNAGPARLLVGWSRRKSGAVD